MHAYTPRVILTTSASTNPPPFGYKPSSRPRLVPAPGTCPSPARDWPALYCSGCCLSISGSASRSPLCSSACVVSGHPPMVESVQVPQPPPASRLALMWCSIKSDCKGLPRGSDALRCYST
eukprot:569911-Prorocentrum_minimum.AAC.1